MTQHSSGCEISLYTDAPASGEEIKTELSKLAVTFPDIDNNYIIILADRLKEHGFSGQRLKHAINQVIDTCPYKRPSIADIISYDRKVKTYSYSEMSALCNLQRTSENFELIEINGKKRWIEK